VKLIPDKGDEWPTCPVCGKPYRVASVDNVSWFNPENQRTYGWNKIVPDCEHVAETEGTV
jgi:hypothetical protein